MNSFDLTYCINSSCPRSRDCPRHINNKPDVVFVKPEKCKNEDCEFFNCEYHLSRRKV